MYRFGGPSSTSEILWRNCAKGVPALPSAVPRCLLRRSLPCQLDSSQATLEFGKNKEGGKQ